MKPAPPVIRTLCMGTSDCSTSDLGTTWHQGVKAAGPANFCSNIVRGITYQSKNRIDRPCVSKTVDNGTLRRICGTRALEIRMKRGGRPADKRLPSAMISPHTNTDIGANIIPTEAMPSVANSEALKLPSA